MGTNSCPWGWWALLTASTWYWYTHLVPPSWILRVVCQPVCFPPMLKWQLEEQTQWPWPTGSETSGPVDSWGVDGKWENEGLGGVMTQMVGRGEGGSKRWFPSAIHRDLPPQTPLWPPWAFPHPSVSSCCASASSLCASSCFLLAWWSSLKP